MSNNFLLCLNFLLKAEGGYVNDKDDKGGPTNFGITKNVYDNYRKSKNMPTQDVRNITSGEMLDIYYNQYYLASGANKIKDPQMSVLVFDTAVNCGSGTAKIMLTKSKGDVDTYLSLRKEYYNNIIVKNPSQEKFRKGWYNRLNNISAYIKNVSSNNSNQDYLNFKKYMGNLNQQQSLIFDKIYKSMKQDEFYDKYFDYSKYIHPSYAKNNMINIFPNSRYFLNNSGHWVTINGNHVFIEDK